MLSAIGLFGAGCGNLGKNDYADIRPDGAARVEAREDSPIAAHPGNDAEPVEDRCESEAIECNEFSSCIRGRCKTRTDYANSCNDFNTVPVGELEIENLDKLIFKHRGAPLKEGQCLRFSARKHTYTVFRPSLHHALGLVITDENGDDYSARATCAKHIRLGDDATLWMGYTLNDGYWSAKIVNVLIHHTIPTSDIKVELQGCEKFADADTCNGFVKNTKELLEGLEMLSGVNLGECYHTIHYILDPSLWGGYASGNGGRGYITVGTFMKEIFDDPDFIDFEYHEPIHLLNTCVNMHAYDDYHHLFWDAVTEQILSVIWNQEKADEYNSYVQYNIDEIDEDRGILDGEGCTGGCPGIKTYVLSKEYQSLRKDERAQFVRKLYQALHDDPRLLSPSTERKAMAEIICGLVSDPDCMDSIKEYCPDESV